MRWFLDMNIVLFYAGEGNRSDLEKKTKKFVLEKNDGKFLLCYYIRDVDLPKWLDRQKIILKEIVRKFKDDSYNLYSSQESSKLTDRDKKKLIKFIVLAKNLSDSDEKIEKITKAFSELERRINKFLQDFIDEFVIPINGIDKELVSHLNSFIGLGESRLNISDVKTLASSIQEHNNKKLTLITADRKDWTKDFLEEVQYHYSLKKKYPSLPKIQYL